MRIQWENEIFVANGDNVTDNSNKVITLNREEICNRLLKEGYCKDRAGGMRLIALAIQQKQIYFINEQLLAFASSDNDDSNKSKSSADVTNSNETNLAVLLKRGPNTRLQASSSGSVKSESANLNTNSDGDDEEVIENSLTPEQKSVVTFVEAGENVFFSGSAGVGKSYLLKFLVRHEIKRRSNGVTGEGDHNARIGTGEDDVETLIRQVTENRAAMRRWRNVELLFIDEVSMLDATLFEKLDIIARAVRNSTRVFGGIQICLSGDFFQLPPVGLGRDLSDCALWRNTINCCTLLTQVFRQREEELIVFLNNFRVGIVDIRMLNLLMTKPRPESSSSKILTVEPTKLFARNVDVDRINAQRLDELHSIKRKYEAYDWFRDPSKSNSNAAALDKLLITPNSLTIAIGAQVVLTKNLKSEIGLVNGSRGVVVGFQKLETSIEHSSSSEMFARCDPNELLPVVQFVSKRNPRIVGRVEFEICENKTKIASRCAVPLKLAFALSIHKSQGQTIDFVDVDLSGTFEYGQAFVALSRASTLDGLFVTGYKDGCLLAHPKVLEFYKQLVQLEHSRKRKNFESVKKKVKHESDVNADEVQWLSKPKAPTGSL